MIKPAMIRSPFPKRHLKAGECVFSQGDQGDYAYIIDEGEIEISTIVHEQEIVLNVLKSGNMFGELALVDGRPRSASAYAKTDVLLTIVTLEQVRSRIQEADPILRLLLMVIMDYFRSETKRRSSLELKENERDDLAENNRFAQLKSEAIELIRLESELRNAIETNELKLFYQCIVDLKTFEIVGFEVLLRWQCTKRGDISPSLFIPLAESTSLIIPIGEWAIKKAIKAILEIKKQTNKDVFMSINIAQRQIESASFLPLLTKQVREAQIKFSQVKLEILERSLFAGETALLWLESCRSFGFPLVIDDFGTGYANLTYLRDFYFDTIKIDKCFINEIENNQKDRNISHALINLSQGLDLTVVAEGIETLSQAKILRNLGCNFGQGYLFSKPVPLEEAISLIQSSKIKNQFGFNLY
jgi:EAL domain-containing protein (putative c-di-GMP-specific phosphodiesterase class I)